MIVFLETKDFSFVLNRRRFVFKVQSLLQLRFNIIKLNIYIRSHSACQIRSTAAFANVEYVRATIILNN